MEYIIGVFKVMFLISVLKFCGNWYYNKLKYEVYYEKG